MSIRMTAAALLLMPQALLASEGSTAFVRGGLSSVGYKEEYSGGSTKAERGGGVNLSGGLRLGSGFALRLDAVGSGHDGVTSCSGTVCVEVDDDLELGEGRLVFLYTPMLTPTLMLEVGGGFESITAEVPAQNFETEIGGLVLEGSLVFLASETWRFNLGLALMALEQDGSNEDVTGGEFRAGFIATVGKSVELGAMLRGVNLQGKGSDSEFESDVGELRLTIGTTWGF